MIWPNGPDPYPKMPSTADGPVSEDPDASVEHGEKCSCDICRFVYRNRDPYGYPRDT